MWDMVDDAIYKTVHEFPRNERREGRREGAVALAPKVGMNAGTLSNKANPGMESFKLSLKESIPIQNVSGDYRILYAYSAELNHVSLPLGDLSGVSDTELLTAYAKLHQEIGETAAAISGALADGRITRSELANIRKEFFEDVQASFELYNRLEAICDE